MKFQSVIVFIILLFSKPTRHSQQRHKFDVTGVYVKLANKRHCLIYNKSEFRIS